MQNGSVNTKIFYLYYAGIVTANLTSCIVVSTEEFGVKVPNSKIDETKNEIYLDISPSAIRNVRYADGTLKFNATFDRVNEEIIVPMRSIKQLVSKELDIGINFDTDGWNDD